VFAGALSYSQYKPLKRLVVRALAAVAGHDTDTSRDYEYTDWQAVERFSASVGKLIEVKAREEVV
jgi:menaquinone-dependent protoporphyrinogen oxidase